jgi:hypothetical protein
VFWFGKDTRVVWRDVARAWQKYEFGGTPNQDPVALRARNRLGILETGGGNGLSGSLRSHCRHNSSLRASSADARSA